DHDRPSLGEPGSPLPRGESHGRDQIEVEALDRLVGQREHYEAAVELAAGRALRGERNGLARREPALAQEAQHQRTHLPGGPDDGYAVPLASHTGQGTATVAGPVRKALRRPASRGAARGSTAAGRRTQAKRGGRLRGFQWHSPRRGVGVTAPPARTHEVPPR